MKRALILAAAAVVLASNIWALVSARQNRRDTPGGTVELTERELSLMPMVGDSTAILLDLNWNVNSSDQDHPKSPGWLTTAKLTELGFDCSLPVNSPNARDHYSSLSSVPVYLVLEFEGEAWKAAGDDGSSKTRLFAVDAGRDPRSLRSTYPDTGRHFITRGLVRILFQDRNLSDGTPLAEPRLRGWIPAVIPSQIFVPPPHNKSLQGLRRRNDHGGEKAEEEPRFAVTVSWGARYEPWVKAIRMLKP